MVTRCIPLNRSSNRLGRRDDAISDSAVEHTDHDALADLPNPPAQRQSARSLRARALSYLSRREYSRAELMRKLSAVCAEPDELVTVLDELERENYLSDARFTESLVHRRAARLGMTRITGELRQHAVDAELIAEVSIRLRETELDRARAVWQKKYGQLPHTPAERMKQIRFLTMRGFSHATIAKVLGQSDEGEHWNSESSE